MSERGLVLDWLLKAPSRVPRACRAATDPADGMVEVRCSGHSIWQIAQTLPGQCRLFVFAYTYPAAAAPALAGELAMLDRELRRMIPHPDPT